MFFLVYFFFTVEEGSITEINDKIKIAAESVQNYARNKIEDLEFSRRKSEKEKEMKEENALKLELKEKEIIIIDREKELERYTHRQTFKRNHNSYDINKKLRYQSLGSEFARFNQRALEKSSDSLKATEFNAAGVASLQILFSDDFDLSDSEKVDSILEESRNSFNRACEEDLDHYHRAFANLAIVQFTQGRQDDAIKSISQAIIKSGETVADYFALRSFFTQTTDWSQSILDIKNAQKLDPRVTYGRYLGLVICMDQFPEQHSSNGIMTAVNFTIENKHLSRVLLWLEFSDKSFVEVANITHETSKFFIENRYVILKKLLPNFVRFNLKNLFDELIATGTVTKGDIQSPYRYVISNDRAAKFIQFSIIDVLRRVILNNIIATYTYFGGYTEGSELAPHSDRLQCMFTVSINIHNHPKDSIWPLKIGNKALFDRVPGNSKSGFLELPPESEWIDAPVGEGDALLFMGRHLNHWRHGKLKKDHLIYHSFVHYVEESFPKDKKLD